MGPMGERKYAIQQTANGYVVYEDGKPVSRAYSSKEQAEIFVADRIRGSLSNAVEVRESKIKPGKFVVWSEDKELPIEVKLKIFDTKEEAEQVAAKLRGGNTSGNTLHNAEVRESTFHKGKYVIWSPYEEDLPSEARYKIFDTREQAEKALHGLGAKLPFDKPIEVSNARAFGSTRIDRSGRGKNLYGSLQNSVEDWGGKELGVGDRVRIVGDDDNEKGPQFTIRSINTTLKRITLSSGQSINADEVVKMG
jgi:hypothetical protein